MAVTPDCTLAGASSHRVEHSLSPDQHTPAGVVGVQEEGGGAETNHSADHQHKHNHQGRAGQAATTKRR